MKPKEKYQTVYIEIKGKVYAFTGKAMPYTTGRIDSIKFSRPKELPDDVHFEEMEIDKKDIRSSMKVAVTKHSLPL